MRAGLSRAINGRFPRLSWNIWSARRTAQQWSPAEIAPALDNLTSRRKPRGTSAAARDSSLLIVVPSADHEEIPCAPAQGNYSFELFETARIFMGADNVRTIRIASDESTRNYHQRILAFARDHRVTHILSRIDIEANGGPHWSWDLFVRSLRRNQEMVYLPLTYDSAYPYVSMHLDRITRLHARAVPIVLDRPIEGVVRPRRPAAGPLFLPLSDLSMATINEALEGVSAEYDITFIGNVSGYPYRSQLLEDLAQAGIDVHINPHGRSEGQLAGFVSYAEALRKSRITLNFTRCNGVPITQLKTRMLEGALFGAVVAADSPLYAQDYFEQGSEFIAYNSPRDLEQQLQPLLEDETSLQRMRERALSRADHLRVMNFWEKTDAALRKNRLPGLT